jgi:hypothetical protein
MTQEKHTPGPWATKPAGDYQSVYDAANKFFEIARVRGFSNHDAEANARLIAAAPKLLAALHRLTTVIALNDVLLNTISSADYETALYAIAEAEGIEEL